MEQVRLLLAIGLSFVVLLIWSVFFVDRQPKNNDEANTIAVKNENIEKNNEEINKKEIQKENIFEKDSNTKDSKSITNEIVSTEKEITIDTPFYTVKLSNKGGAFKSFTLKKYKETVDPESPYKELIPNNIKNGIINSSTNGNSIPGMEDAVYTINSDEHITLKDKKESITFKWISSIGTTVSKTYVFDPQSYLISLNINIDNNSDKSLEDKLVLSIEKEIEEDNNGYGFSGPSGLINNSVEQVKIKKIDENIEYKGNIKWIAIEDRYFTYSIVPEKPIEGTMKLIKKDEFIFNHLISESFTIRGYENRNFNYLIFLGPKSMELLNSLGHDLDKALNFGFFDIIAKPCLWFMNRIHSVIPNYGLAIIILTIITKILLWPLGSKSYKSMNDMKRLQPLMAEIREKYKNDKQKMNQELMSLYKTYKINPMGGCLPMILQIPVFFALYRMLYQAIELRHAPFIFWINDLSAPDRLFHFSFSIPFMQAPYGIPVLTIIMGATMFIQQKMSPPPGDPAQAKMMMLMPIVFTFIFINFSSGLVLYWLVNNVLSISQQYYIQKKAI